MRIIAENDFHGTCARINVRDWVITPQQLKRLRKKLCVSDCNCFADHTKFRDPQNDNRLFVQPSRDGGLYIQNA